MTVEVQVLFGPCLSDFRGDLDTPVMVCTGCSHLSVFEGNFAFCGAQRDTHATLTRGTFLSRGAEPNEACPYPPREETRAYEPSVLL